MTNWVERNHVAYLVNKMCRDAVLASRDELAALLETTPKNISNWCSRGQIPALYLIRFKAKLRDNDTGTYPARHIKTGHIPMGDPV